MIKFCGGQYVYAHFIHSPICSRELRLLSENSSLYGLGERINLKFSSNLHLWHFIALLSYLQHSKQAWGEIRHVLNMSLWRS